MTRVFFFSSRRRHTKFDCDWSSDVCSSDLWWGSLYKDFVAMGAAGFWNDMNEPSVFFRADKTMPLDTVHRLDDGTAIDHRAAHNIFGMENARATYEGVLKLQAGERPFVLTRAAYSGAQRYAATWTGDNSSTWNHLKMSTPMLMSMGISGMPLVGDDIGGFAGSPTPDLLTRWFEVGVGEPAKTRARCDFVHRVSTSSWTISFAAKSISTSAIPPSTLT